MVLEEVVSTCIEKNTFSHNPSHKEKLPFEKICNNRVSDVIDRWLKQDTSSESLQLMSKFLHMGCWIAVSTW